MTKEEAISLLTQVHEILVNSNSWSENTHKPLNMAFDMAIKALEQLEQNSSDDVISREFVKYEYRRRFIENLTDNARGIDLTKYVDIDCQEFNAFIDSIPSTVSQPMYCPNCGTKMVEPQESEV